MTPRVVRSQRRTVWLITGAAIAVVAVVGMSAIIVASGDRDAGDQASVQPRFSCGRGSPSGGDCLVGGVWDLAWSPDGTKIAISGADDVVRVWDVASNTPVGPRFTGGTNGVEALAWSPDGTKIAGRVRSGIFSADGSSSNDPSAQGAPGVWVWDAATGAVIGEPFVTAHSMAWSPDGTKIAIAGPQDDPDELDAGFDGFDRDEVRVLDAASGAEVGEPIIAPIGTVDSVAWLPDGTRIAARVADPDTGTAALLVWDAVSGAPVGEPLTLPNGRWTLSPDGTRIVVVGSEYSDDPAPGERDSVRVWDLASAAPIGEPLTDHLGPVRTIAWSPDGSTIAGGAFLGERVTSPAGATGDIYVDALFVWDVASGALVGQPIPNLEGSVSSVAWSPDGSKIASGGGDDMVRVSDSASGARIGDPITGR